MSDRSTTECPQGPGPCGHSAAQLEEYISNRLESALQRRKSTDPAGYTLIRASKESPRIPFSWDSFNSLVALKSLPATSVVLSQKGSTLPRQTYSRSSGNIDIRSLTTLAKDGATVLLHGADEWSEALARITTHLTNKIRSEVKCNLFATFFDSQAFESHFDEVDALVIQLEGRKHWQLHGISEVAPLPQHNNSDPSLCPPETLLDTVLEPGDILYFPRGYWHTVRGAGTSSLHATFAITRPTGHDLLRWLVWKTLEIPYARMDLPDPASDENGSFYTKIVEAFIATAQNESLQSYESFLEASNSSNPSPAFPQSVLETPITHRSQFSLNTNWPPKIYANRDSIWFFFDQKTVKLPLIYHEALEMVFTSRNFTIDSLSSRARTPVPHLISLSRKLETLGVLQRST